jgi:epoxyqueuosine reductase
MVPVLDLLAASDDELIDRHGRWYLHDREPRWLRRNALVVLGNIGRAADPATVATLERYLADPDPMLRAHAVWAAGQLGRHDLLVELDTDPDPAVREELLAGRGTL